jgi:hypothetical protein
MRCFYVGILFLYFFHSADAQVSPPDPEDPGDQEVELELEVEPLTPLYHGKVKFADIDNDNDLDLFQNGFSGEIDGFELKVYENVNGVFIERATDLPDVRNGSFSLGDFDNDGDLDFLITGLFDNSMDYRTEIHENKGGLIFAFKASLIGLFNSSGSFVDLENDGDLDVVLSGSRYRIDEQGNGVQDVLSVVYENVNNQFVEVKNTNLVPCVQCSMDWADRNGDGLVDVAMTGFREDYSQGMATVCLNNGNKTFTKDPSANFHNPYNGDIAWGDFDRDGDNDLLLSGYVPEQFVTTIYENQGETWKERTDIELEPVGESYRGSLQWIDYNADGYLDIVTAGRGGSPLEIHLLTRVYINDQLGNFYLLENTDHVGLGDSSLDFGDCDNDGDVDVSFLGIGMFGDDWEHRAIMSGLYRNQTYQKAFTANIKPVAPDLSTLTEKYFRKSVTLKWNVGTDAETPSLQLSYNARVRSATKEIVRPTVDFITGYNRTDNMPNGSGRAIWLNNIPEGVFYYISVQAIDGGKNGSSFSAEKQFYQINGPETISAKIEDTGHIRIDWKDNSTIETSYQIARSLDPSTGFITVKTLATNTVSFIDAHEFQFDKYYYYRVWALNSIKASGYDSVKVLIPIAPASLTAQSPHATRVELAWRDLTAYEKGYLLERKKETDADYVVIAELAPGTTIFSDLSVAEGTTYQYRVVAFNEYGKSAYSNVSAVRTNTTPVAENFELEVLEDGTLPFSATDFSSHYFDADNNSLNQVRFISGPTNGTLKLEDVNVSMSTTIDANLLDNLSFVPSPNIFGPMVYTFSVNDGTDFSLTTYTLTINVLPVNDPPQITEIDDISIEAGEILPEVSFKVTDIDTDLNSLELSAVSDNTSLIGAEGLAFTGGDADRILHLTPIVDASGSSLISISVSDGEHTVSTTFTLEISIVLAVEDTKLSLQLYPVPTEDYLYFKTLNSVSVDVTLTDITGKVLLHTTLGAAGSLDLSDFPSGVYFAHIKTQNYSGVYRVIKK